MERIDHKTASPLLKAEHEHRYVWAARAARGHVLDAACGVGYGAPLLCKSPAVTRYTGVDCSQETIDRARKEFKSAATKFVTGDVLALPFPDATFDTVVSLETIEHLATPAQALAEFARVLKPDGILLGSVPQAEFEAKCIEAYGPNEFHKSKFTLAELKAMVRAYFPTLELWNCWLSVASVVAPLGSAEPRKTPAQHTIEADAPWGTPLGSLLFAASRSARARLPEMRTTRIFPAVSVVEHELTTLAPRDLAIRNQTRMIDERDLLIRRTESLLEARRAENEAQARLIADRDVAIARQTRMIEERDGLIHEIEARIEERRRENEAQAGLVADRDAAIARQTEMIDERDRVIRENDSRLEARRVENEAQARLVDERNAAIARQTQMIDERDALLREQARAHLARVSSLETQASSLSSQLAGALEELAAATAGRDSDRKQLLESNSARDAMEKDLASASRQLQEHALLVKAQADELESKGGLIRTLEAAVSNRDKSVADLTESLAGRNALLMEYLASIASLESRLSDSHSVIARLQLESESQRAAISSLEQRVLSLGGSLSMVRDELRRHLSDLQRPVFCFKQTTRAVFGLGNHANSHAEDFA